MPIIKTFLYIVLLIFLGSCATRLESSRDYLAEGDKESAAEVMLEHVRERSVKELSSSEFKTGIDFLTLLQDMNSPSLLNQVYDLKFTSASFDKNYFIYSGRFSETILSLAQKWQMVDLQRRIAFKIDSEISVVQKGKYEQAILSYASFGAIELSKNNQQHRNLSEYWGTMPYEKYLKEYQAFWKKVKENRAHSIDSVLKINFLERVNENREQILNVADKTELSFIFSQELNYSNKAEFNALRNAMRKIIDDGRKNERIVQGEIEVLKPRVLAAADRLQKLEAERRDLQVANQYTFEERVQCQVCTGRGEVSCGPCRGQGICRHCDRGRVDCGRCFRRGILSCGPCHGRGWYKRCDRVWDRCKKCYVNVYVRVDCRSCFGSGHFNCGCHLGRAVCGRCNGHFECRTCRGRRFVSCTSCVNGTVVEVRKTAAGQDIDNRISAAETQQSAILSRLNKLEWIVRKEKARRETFSEFL